jgi:trehalose 6-phosphate synthase/phosphatase
MTSHKQRIVIVSNRLPFSVSTEDGTPHFRESTGGLVTGLSSFLVSLRNQNKLPKEYLWIGWPGEFVEPAVRGRIEDEARLRYNSCPVFLSREDMDQFYLGFCNKTIWPLFHYFPSLSAYEETMWDQYRHVNNLFCERMLAVLRPDDIVWIHDYHLMLLPQLVKQKLPNVTVGFFLHIPFPSFEIFRLLPGLWRREILEGLVGADLVGFHTYEYTQHFLQCVLRILGHDHTMGQILLPERVVKVDTFPMGIHYDKFATAAASPEVLEEAQVLKSTLGDARVILSVDRLDYTKGILNRLQGFEILLDTRPHFRQEVVLVLVVVPSRIGVDDYERMKRQIDELVGRINGRFGTIGWTPVIYQYRYLPFVPLVALYRISDVALVTPTRDGMNLIAKEHVASRLDGTGVLILSETAGAAKELGEAIIINPNNRMEIVGALEQALEMPVEEQLRRTRIMQARLQRYTVRRWAQDFLVDLLRTADAQKRYSAKLLSPTCRQALLHSYQQGRRRILFLDYDGTLVPFVLDPTSARPSETVRDLLLRLSRDPANTVVLISGRDRLTLDRWFGELPIGLVAEHGNRIREKNSEWRALKSRTNEWKPALLPILQLFADRLPGSHVEEKEYSLVWHYRGADPEQGQVVARELTDQLVTFTANIDVQIMRGNKVIEIRTAGINKGTAALQFTTQDNYDFILSIGDDWTDEDLFAVLSPKAYSIKVGLANTHARFNVRAVGDVLRLLDMLSKTARSTPPVNEHIDIQ